MAMIMIIIIGMVAILLLAPTCYMLGRQCYIHIIHKKKPFGTDKTMTDWPTTMPVFNGFQFKHDHNWPQFFHQFKLNVEALTNQPNSPLAIYFDQDQQCFCYHSDLQISDTLHEYDTKAACCINHLKNNLSIIINCCPQDAWINIIWDHACFDGARLYNEVLAPLFALKVYQPDPYFSQYTPFLTETRMALLAWQYRRIGKSKPFNTFDHYSKQSVCLFEFNSQLLKKLKKKYQCSLSEIMLAVYCYQLFSISKATKKTLTFGTLVACHHPRFRNNYSIMCIEIHRAIHLKNIIKQIKQQRYQKENIQAMYQLLTFSRTQTYLKENILDCLISPFFFQAKRAFSSQINNFEFMNLPTSLPLYSLYISYKNTVHLSITINTPDIDLNKLKRKPFKIIPFNDVYSSKH